MQENRFISYPKNQGLIMDPDPNMQQFQNRPDLDPHNTELGRSSKNEKWL
jgi:hypothetical protein